MTRYIENSHIVELDPDESEQYTMRVAHDEYVKFLFDSGETGEAPPEYTLRVDERIRAGDSRVHKWQTTYLAEHSTEFVHVVDRLSYQVRVTVTAHEEGVYRWASLGEIR